MANVRSLLRNERAIRQIPHPHASYSSTGSLQCNVCRVPLKSDAEIWNKHLKSSQHAMRAERLRISSGKPAHQSTDATGNQALLQSTNKKRKAEDDEEEGSRKRKKPTPDPEDTLPDTKPSAANIVPTSSEATSQEASKLQASPEQDSTGSREMRASTDAGIDEDEWAAFERDIARPASPVSPISLTATHHPSALNAAATITATPITAAELTAQQSESAEGSSRRETRDLEIEAEREDAARALEQEFDEMEALEDRVRRLKKKREEIRRGMVRAEYGVRDMVEGAVAAEAMNGLDEENHESDDEFDDEWDSWGRR